MRDRRYRSSRGDRGCTERQIPTPQPTPVAKSAIFAAKDTSGQKITEKTKFVWFPFKARYDKKSKEWVAEETEENDGKD